MKRFSFLILVYVFSFSAICGDLGVTKKQFIQKYNYEITKIGKSGHSLDSIKIKKSDGENTVAQYIVNKNVSGVGQFDSKGKMNHIIWFMSGDAESDDVDKILTSVSGAVMMDVLDDSISLSKASEMLADAISEFVNSEKNEFEFFSSNLKYKISKSDVLPLSIEVSKK